MRTISIDQSLHFKCPSCGKALDVSITWIESNSNISCTKCGEVVGINVDDVRKKIEEVNNQIGNIELKEDKK